jgi:hypothetical protein
MDREFESIYCEECGKNWHHLYDALLPYYFPHGYDGRLMACGCGEYKKDYLRAFVKCLIGKAI